MDITINKEMIWKRIKAGGPTSLIVLNNEEMCYVTSELLKTFDSEINNNHITPICVNCKLTDKPVAFFKTVFISIWNLISAEGKSLAESFKTAIELAEETSTIDAILENFMPMVKDYMNINCLLIFENFDKAVINLDEPDLMKIRGMSSYINMVTISHKSLEALASECKKEDYFCNQFKSFNI